MQVWDKNDASNPSRVSLFSFQVPNPCVAVLFFSMRSPSSLQCAIVRFWVPLLLVATLCYASYAEVSGNEVNTNGKLVNEELTKTSLEGHNEEEKFKGFFHHKPIFKKPIPIHNEEEKFKGFFHHKPIFKKPIPIVKPIPKPIPIVKPVYIPVHKPIPVFKPIPKPIPIVNPIPVYKPIPKPFIVKKPIPAVEQQESFLKPKHFFKKHIPKLSFHPKFKKPIIPIHKPIPTP